MNDYILLAKTQYVVALLNPERLPIYILKWPRDSWNSFYLYKYFKTLSYVNMFYHFVHLLF